MADARGSERRCSTRIIPVQPVKIAVESETNPPTDGVVADISEGGACVCTDATLGVGEDILLRLITAIEEQVPAAARVVWKGGKGTGAHLYGIQWTHAGPPRMRLRLLIDTLR